MTPAEKRRLFRAFDPRPIKLRRCGCGVFTLPWRDFCWTHELSMRVDLEKVWSEFPGKRT